MKSFYVMPVVAILVSGCAGLGPLDFGRPTPTPEPIAQEGPAPAVEDILEEDPPVVEDIPAEPETAPTGERDLGTTVVSLGDPTDTGLWIKTSAVTTPTTGRVTTQTGTTLAVELRPLGTAEGGAQISLEALRELGLPITGLAEVTLTAL